MRKIFLLGSVLFAVLFFAGNKTFAQCALTGNNFGSVSPGCNGFGASLSLPSTSYGSFSAIQGVNYTISTCGTGWDSQITGYDASNNQITSGQTSPTSGGGLYNDDAGPDCSTLQASINWTATYTGTVKLLVDRWSCGSTWETTSAVLQIRQNTTITNTTQTNAMCGDGSTKPLTVSYTDNNGSTYPTTHSGSPAVTWSIVSGPGSISGSTYTATGVSGSSQVVTIRAALGPCTDDVSFTVYNIPTTANAGADQTLCNNSSFTLAGNTPSIGSGAWSVVSGTATVTTPSSPTSTVTGVSAGASATLRWTITNGLCTSTDDVALNNHQAPTDNAAGADIACQSSSPTAITLSGATLGGSATTGAWSILSGGGTLSSAAQTATPASVTYTPAANFSGTVTLRLTTNDPDGAGPCTAATSSRTIVVNPAATAIPGGPDATCQSSSPSAITLSGSSVGGSGSTGAWSILSGGGSLSSTAQTNSPSTVTYTPAANFTGTATLQLTTDDPDGAGPCTATTAIRTVQVNQAAVAAAGGPDAACESSSPSAITLSGSSVSGSASTGAWSILSGGGSLSSTTPSATPSTVTYTPAPNFTGTVTLQLQTDDPAGICAAVTSTRTIIVGPPPTAEAGGPDVVCQSSSPSAITLIGATIGGSATTGTWTIISGSGTLSNTSATANPDTVAFTPAANFNGTVTLQLTTDAPASCTAATDTRTITIHALPSTAPTNNSPVCAGAQINLNANASGGAPAYTYNWSGANSFTSGNASPSLTNATSAMSGTYNVTVTDQNLCSVSGSTTVTVNPLPNGNISGTATVCAGVTDTVLTFNFSTGTAPFDITYTDGSNSFSKSGVNNGDTIHVAVGASGTVTNYSFTQIQDANGCVRATGFSGGASITVATSPVITNVVATNVLCNGTGTGTITITASSGTPAYTYSIDSGVSYQSSNSFTGLFAGNYVLKIADALNCASSASTPVTITEPTALSHTYTVDNASCTSVSNGRITVTPSGGTAPYNYSLNGGPSQSGNVLGGLASGTYILQVADNNGCTDTSHILIDTTYSVSANLVSKTDVSCFGGLDGAVTVELSGGISPYTYSVNGIIFQSSPAFTNLAAGNYVVTLRDSTGCTAYVSANIIQPNLLQVLVDSVENILCNGGNSGAIYITVAGGNGGYTYLWSNADTTEDISGLTAGTYNVAVTDSKGCSTSAGATITQPLPLFLNVASYENLRCYNDSSGRIDITVNGGVPPYSFDWSNGAATEDVIHIPADSYSVTVTDANGCTDSLAQSITQPLQLTSSISSTNISCAGGAGGSVDLTVNDGTAPYNYLWSNGATTEDLSNVSGGTYSVIIHDDNGCSATNVTTVTASSPLNISTSVTNVLCHDSLTGEIDLTVSGGAGNYSYAWNTSDTTQNLTNIGAGTYSVVVTDSNSCSASASATVTQPAGIVVNATTTTGCAGGANGSIDVTVGGGVFPYTYLWNDSVTTEDRNNLSAGTYSVTITDANGCSIIQSFNITATTPITSSIAGTNVTCNGASDGSADLTVSGGISPYTFLWNTFQNTEDISNLNGGIYYVIITDANGCTHRDSVIISEAPAISLTTSVTNVLCHDSLTGEIDLTVSGGAGNYSYAWNTSDTTQNLTNIGAGNYSVVVTDSNSCSASASAMITQPAGIVVNATTTTGCAGGANGSIDITVGGGVFPYTYLWNDNATTEDRNNLSGGTYTVTITDANGCSIIQSFNITATTPITSSIAGTNVTCNGASDGSADLSVSGGISPYTFLWNTFQNTEDISGLHGGIYYVIITDANGCTHRDSVIVNEAPAIMLTTSVTNILCHDSLTGAVDLTVSGGAGISSYLWNTGDTTQNISNIGAGNYSVVVTDSNSCSASASATVNQSSPISVSGSVTNARCADGTDGSIFLSINGGVPTYNFVWSDSATTQNILNLAAGNYDVTITDAGGCSASASYTITAPAAQITSTVTSTNVSCYGANSGTASVSASSGSLPYTYFWSDFESTDSISGLHGGVYFVIITDANGCTHRDSTIISEPTQFLVSVSATNISCSNSNNGAIDITVSGGTPSYSYLWSNADTTEDVSNLAGGQYVVTVTDQNSCTVSAAATIANPSAIETNYVVHPPLCSGNTNGWIDLIPSGGTLNYSFVWSNGDTTEDIRNIGAGEYLFTLTDAHGCTKSDSITVTEPSPFYVSGVVKHVTCHGYNDGAVDETPYGGTPPYSFSWSTHASTEDLWNLPGGSDTVHVSDINGCLAVSIYVVNEPARLTDSIVSSNISCAGNSNGSLAVVPSGGTTPYRYLWDDFNSDSLRTALAAGRYAVQVTDSNGCFVLDTARITQPTAISITGVVANAGCSGADSGAIHITVTGGTPSYTYLWTGGATTQDTIHLAAGVYSVTVTDSLGCTKTDSFTVNQSVTLFTSVSSNNPICYGGNTGFILVDASGGTAPYTYTWNSPQHTGALATNLTAGNYSVTVSDANHCSATLTDTLQNPAAITVTANANAIRCAYSTTAVNASVTGGTYPYSYVLNGVTEDTGVFYNLPAGDYLLLVIDVNGCQGKDSFNVISAPPINVSVAATQQVILTGMETQLIVATDSGVSVLHYSWIPDSLFTQSSCTDCADPHVAPRTTTIFTVTVMSADSCYASDTVTVYVNDEASAFIPTAFTPNGDQLNDNFDMDILGATKIEVSIFNRWGERIYYNPDQPNGVGHGYGWDGKVDGKPAPFDTYVYQIRVTYWDNTTKDFAGTVTLMK